VLGKAQSKLKLSLFGNDSPLHKLYFDPFITRLF
jgi:hypothetical protein